MLRRVSDPDSNLSGYEEDLHCALVEGLITRDQMEPLLAEARRLGRGPLELLRERGLLSPDTLAALKEQRTKPSEPGPYLEAEAPATRRPGDSGAPAPSTEPVFPLPHWDRYQAVRFLGQGGMGQVFLAYDPRLRRNVALKFVRDDAPELAQRFLLEARAQARVRHERVCEMYEVGEAQGRAFIAMQYVNGSHLGQLARELSLEQKLLLLRDVAEGVHAAHHAGLIHRDLKPSNILVERAEDGRLVPYVMDFGLARDWHEEHTTTGAVLGTPHYMAPEQARGEVGRLDRRVDVYSLGATLYQVLTGVPPFTAGNALELLGRIQTEEPRPPRQLDADIPEDVEAIVLKCLEKERSARYDSARALAEDLERFLSGEPVRARRAGPGYRLRKKLKKHRLVVGLGSLALGGVLLALGQAALTRGEVLQRERLAQRFTERVERLEAQARYSLLSPLHDTRADRSALREDMRALEQEIHQAGGSAEAPGHYALGRALLALGDTEGALTRLESAWTGGYQEGRVAYALALALGRLYQERLPEVESLKDAAQREERRREIEQRYRDPALAYLKRSEGAGAPSAGHVAALRAFYEGRHEEALAALEAPGAVSPWLHEGPLLRGDILHLRALQRRHQGERAGAQADLEAARAAYTTAAAIGESDPAVYRAQATLHLSALLLELYGPGEVQPHEARAREALAHALAADPEDVQALRLRARLMRRMAEFRLQQGGEARPLLDEGLAAARAALALVPGYGRARSEFALLRRLEARFQQERGEDPRDSLRQAVESFEQLAPAERDYAYQVDLGNVFKVWADYEDQSGGDSLHHRDQAIEAYLAATARDARPLEGWVNLGTAYFKRATHPRAPDADGDLERAREALERVRSIDASNFVSCYYGAQVHEWRARRQHNRGGDALPELTRALALYRQGLAINARLPQLPNALGGALLWRAELAWDEGKDPFPLLDEAQAAFEQARAVAPQQGFAYNNLGEVHAGRALYHLRRGEDPTPHLQAALEGYAQALAHMPKQAQFQVNTAKAHHTQALWLLEQGRDPSPAIQQASDALQRALELHPGMGYALYTQGRVGTVRARGLTRRGQARGTDFEPPARALQHALEADPEWQEYRLAAGELRRDQAAWLEHTGADPTPVLREGVEQVNQVLAARPHWARAHAVHAHLLLALARTPASERQREVWRDEARAELDSALAHNPNLAREWAAPSDPSYAVRR
uniref:Serine/threonine kinase family protein n=1 Tax=Melittangium lichenicola TaxID=45 RepID=A0A3Q8I349_9BACT|nr:serine/threonine kinase family protein [Melittangium lichenicola]